MKDDDSTTATTATTAVATTTAAAVATTTALVKTFIFENEKEMQVTYFQLVDEQVKFIWTHFVPLVSSKCHYYLLTNC